MTESLSALNAEGEKMQTILMVSRDPFDIEDISRLLHQKGYSLVSKGDGASALK